LTITRDCDRQIDERKRLPTVQMLSEVAKQVRRKEGKATVKPHTTRLPKQQEDQKGMTGERGGRTVTLLGKGAIRRGERGWMLTIKSHGIEFAIAVCVEEIFCNRWVEKSVRDPYLIPRGLSAKCKNHPWSSKGGYSPPGPPGPP